MGDSGDGQGQEFTELSVAKSSQSIGIDSNDSSSSRTGARAAKNHAHDSPKKFDDDDTRLVEALYEFMDETAVSQPRKKARFLLRNTVHEVHDSETGKTHHITSWKMADYEYKKDPCPFPTRARGLFTEDVGDGRYRVVARGYNKFFNVGEVSWTKWETLTERTRGPYYLTLKSNGCIILIAALSPSDILVTSKHSIGALDDHRQSHAQRGEQWLDRHLARVGKTRKQLAKHLWQEKLTAVAELCDDEFEEHVIGYTPDTTGLHLHGLNHNTRHLLTYPPDEVAAFAREWGFIETAYETLDSVEQVKRFTDECAKTGQWRSQYTEGFVVRATSTDHDDLYTEQQRRLRAFMWKVKFDEPYLMWREWREKTKAMLSNKKKGIVPSQPAASAKGKAHKSRGASAGEELYGINAERIQRLETRLYVRWCAKAIDEHPEWFETYADGSGIIAVRERFVEWLSTGEGQEAMTNRDTNWQSVATAMNGLDNGSEAGLSQNVEKQEFDKTLIVPIAIPGCGKTTMSLALTELFDLGHTQSDDITAKKPAPHFLASVKRLLQDDSRSVIIADKRVAPFLSLQGNDLMAHRNNHCRQHREDLAHIVENLHPKVSIRMVALVWDVDERAEDEVVNICSSRISARGERHQSLRPSDSHVDNVLSMFLKQRDAFDPVMHKGDSQFHAQIIVPIDQTPMEMLDGIIDRLVEADVIKLDPHPPSRKQKDEAIDHALEYHPHVRKAAQNGPRSKTSKAHLGLPDQPASADAAKDTEMRTGKPRYYGVSIDFDLSRLFEGVDIQLPGSITKTPHLTIVHKQELPGEQLLWKSCEDHVGDEVDVVLGPRVALLPGRVASLEARYDPPSLIEGTRGDEMHVTVAIGEGIKAIMGKHIMHAMRSAEEMLDGQKYEVIDLHDKWEVRGTIRGLFS